MSKRKIFQETFFNPTTKQKYHKNHLEIDPRNNLVTQMVLSLYEFQNRWEKKEGGIPDELDARCITMLGMRFRNLIPTLMEMDMRTKMHKDGSIQNIFQYFPRMDVEGKSYSISKEEHEIICLHLEALVENTDNIIPFLDSLADFKI
jgi:hypothetical protein